MLDNVRAIATDFSGVLVRDGFPRVVSDYERIYKLEEDLLQKAKNKNWGPFATGQIAYKQYWLKVFGEVGLVLSDSDIEYINAQVTKSHTPLPALESARKLKTKYDVVGLITNCPQEWFEEWDRLYSLSATFNPIIVSYKEKIRKPDPELFLKFCEVTGLPSNYIGYFDDRKSNVKSASDIGMQAIQVVEGEDPFLELLK